MMVGVDVVNRQLITSKGKLVPIIVMATERDGIVAPLLPGLLPLIRRGQVLV